MNYMIEMKIIPKFEGYSATLDGRIYSHKSKKFLKSCGGAGNYQVVTLHINKKRTTQYVHRLVAMAWLPNPNNYPQINHKDECKDNNRLDNLEWCSLAQNQQYQRNLHKRKMHPVVCIETGEEYKSIRYACIVIGAKYANLTSHLKYNSPKLVAGCHWRYK